MSRNVSVASGVSRFVQNIAVGPHALQADEQRANGGNDAGPDPHELLLAALGACTSITVQMYAKRKQWPVQEVRVHLSYAKVPLGNGSGEMDGVKIQISLSGDLSDDQRRRLLDIVERCPIHRLLTSPVKIQTNLLVSKSVSDTQ